MFLSAFGREPPFVCKVVAGGIAGSAGVRVGDALERWTGAGFEADVVAKTTRVVAGGRRRVCIHVWQARALVWQPPTVQVCHPVPP